MTNATKDTVHSSSTCRILTRSVNDDLCTACRRNKTEWVAVMHGQNGTVKIAYRNPAALALGLAGQTKEGWVAASVYERLRTTYADNEQP